MALLGLLQISIAFICFLTFNFPEQDSETQTPDNWPVLGTFSGLIQNLHHVYDWSTDVLEASNLTFRFKDPKFARIDILATVDPANIHYVMSSNHTNFPKGPEFKEIFDILGNGIINVGLLVISIGFICILTFNFFTNKNVKHKPPTNWPLLGKLPGLIHNLHHVYDWSTHVLEATNLTFRFTGPWFAGIDFLITVDPANIHHIMSSNYTNFPKGPEFKEIFDVLGDGIFNADSALWKILRTSAHAIIKGEEFHRFLVRTIKYKLEKGLIPVLDHFVENKTAVDLQDLFQRFTSDTTSIFVMGYDLETLSIDFPDADFSKALDDAEEAIFYRHLKPRAFWKLQGVLGVGDEKKMRNAESVFNRELTKFLSVKREAMNRGSKLVKDRGEGMDMMTAYMNLDGKDYALLNPNEDKFLKDTIMNFMIAGRDTTSTGLSWFFWLISKHPETLRKIRQEINENRKLSESIDLENMVYLHCAICEALRLYPPLPFQHKLPVEPDTLPSGHRLEPNTKVMLSLYALGRMKSVWGDDAWEFKPERWISGRGRVKHEPSYKFLSFNAGPRTCLGKTMAFDLMKMVAVEMIHNYDIEVVQGHLVEPSKSVILRMKHGLRVTVSKRCL